jgi:GAF domain-containing protein
MVIAPIPANEDARLKALRDLLLLDTLPEARYNNIVEFAAAEFNVPMVLISLVDNDRQWFKASVGMSVCETSRDVSFCGHAILAPDTLVVPDALGDVRFMDNPLVIGEPHIRFYAGAPLILPDGDIVGTLCLLDTEPRYFELADLLALGQLRSLVVEQLMTGAVIV